MKRLIDFLRYIASSSEWRFNMIVAAAILYWPLSYGYGLYTNTAQAQPIPKREQNSRLIHALENNTRALQENTRALQR